MRILLLALVVWAGQAWGADTYFSGNQLMSYCEADTTAKQNICNAYVAGVSDGISVNKVIFPVTSSDEHFDFNDVCRPEGVDTVQLAKVWTKWANEQPEKLHMAASVVVTQALAKAFPCR